MHFSTIASALALGLGATIEAKIGSGSTFDDSYGKDRALKKDDIIEYNGSESRDITLREGIGESAGIPGIEYLGLGYNIFEGNPHGSDEGPIDPGFRNRAIALVQNQDTLTSSQLWLRPLGVATKPLRACEFSSTSSEISNSRQYKTELNKEVKQSYSTSLSGQGVAKGVPFQLSSSFAFEKSRKFESFREGSIEQSEVSYEAKAICTNFHAQFEPYYAQTLSSAFEVGLSSLPVPYDETNNGNRTAYDSFIAAFGTHIVSEVSIGAKHIYTSKISTEDVMDLTRDKVDIASSMSFDLQASIFGDATKANEQIAAATSKGGSSDNSITVIVTNQVPTTSDEDGGDAGDEASSFLGASGSFSTTQASSTSSFSEAQEKIKKKIKSIEEVNIGGVPPADGNWKTWASDLVSKGMPVQWSLVPIWDFMTDDQTAAFTSSFIDLYGFDLNQDGESESILDLMHFGVADGTGKPISSYTSSAGSDYRTLVVASQLPRAGDEDSTALTIIEGSEGTDGTDPVDKDPIYCDPGDFVCGFDLYYDDYKATSLAADFVDEEGIAEMQIKCCQSNDWSVNYKKIVQDYQGSSGTSRGRADKYDKYRWARVSCPTGGYVIGAEGKEYSPSQAAAAASNQNDPMGLTGVRMYCSNDRERSITVFDSKRGNVNGGAWREAQYAEDGFFVRGVSVRYVEPDGADGGGGALSSKDDQGITGFTLHVGSLESTGANHAIYTRKIVAESPNGIAIAPFATAIRGNVSPHALEDSVEGGLLEGFESGEYYPFSFYRPNDDSTNPTLAVMDFQDSFLSACNLDAFSFLAIRNPPDNLNVIAGVVHPQGYPVNDLFGSTLGYDVSMNSNVEFVIEFADGAFDGGATMPTVLTMPAWFSSTTFPRDVNDLLVAPSEDACDSTSCTVTVGGVDEEGLEKSLGFSFLAISDTVPGLIHGRVSLTDSDMSYTGTGFTVTDDRDVDNGGILIVFDTRFDAIPSVIATPLAIVEHVNRKQVYIKSGPAADFHFVAVGPPPS